MLDADRHTECPDCGTRVHCGIIGLANLEKRHRGTKTCIEAKAKHDKEATKKKNGSLLTFFGRPKASAVPSIIPTSVPVHSHRMAATLGIGVHLDNDAASSVLEVTEIMGSASGASVSRFLNKLQRLIKNIPVDIPEAGDNDKLAIFGGNPKDFDNDGLDPDDLWEEVLNPLLKSSLGWGSEGNMEEIICRGRRGAEGLAMFVEYFVEKRGVSESLFEGKLSYLLSCLEKM